MKILFLTPSLPSRLHRIRAYQLIKYLSRYHQVYLLSLYPPKQEEADLVDLAHYCQDITVVKQPWLPALSSCFFALTQAIPLEVAFCQNKEFTEVVEQSIRAIKPELIYVKRLRMVPSVLRVSGVPIVIDATDAMSMYYQKAARTIPWYKKILYLHEAYAYERYEKAVLRRFRHVVVCAEDDAEYLRRLRTLESASVEVVPNGVDTEYYTFCPFADKPRSNLVLFSGLMDKYVNTSAISWFVRHVWPKVVGELPEARLQIVGPKPTREVKSLASFSVAVLGMVGDIREYIEDSSVVVCPTLTGAGARNKILQAWSMGTPVVTTTEGAKGLDVVHGQNALVADKPSDFASYVFKVLDDDSLAESLALQGRRTVTNLYSMDQVITQLNAYLEQIIKHSNDSNH